MAIITISRQIGSKGDEIASLVASKLNYELITREIIHQKAESCDLDFKTACSAYEAEEKPKGFFERLFFGEPAYTALFESMNYELAARGDVIMLGRGANFALANVPGVLKVRIVAPESVRAQRIADQKGVPLSEAIEYVERHGRHRRALIESIYHDTISAWSRYDLVLNTVAFSAEESADIISTAAMMVGKKTDKEERKKILLSMAFAKKVERIIKKSITTLAYRDITVDVLSGGKIVLRGVVSDIRSKETAADVASKIEGVTEVDNQLRTTELSF